MDLSKAFDTLDHELLIAKVHDKKSLRLTKSYLSDRWQRTKIYSSYSFFLDNKITEAQGKVTDTTIEAPTNYHGSLNGRLKVVSLQAPL